MGERKEQKFRFNIEANRVAYLNKIYMFSTCMMWVLFVMYSWMKLSYQMIHPLVVYANTAAVVAFIVVNFITFFKNKGSKKIYKFVTIINNYSKNRNILNLRLYNYTCTRLLK